MLQNEKLFQLFNSISDNSEIYRLSPSSSQHDLLHLVCFGIPILAVFQNLRWNSNKTSLTSFVSQHTCDRRIFGLINGNILSYLPGICTSYSKYSYSCKLIKAKIIPNTAIKPAINRKGT